MPLIATDVDRLAKLARLELSQAEAAQTLAQLNSVFELISQLQAIDTEGVEPMTHPIEMSLRLRPDEVTETDRRERYQQAAPAIEQGLFLVPRVIE
jgi:aspartyl-tRNA(Asn)/glutamyl-tRNA(Gln) amidotransferase subunit C